MSILISEVVDFSRPYIALGTTASAAKKLASKKREIDLPKSVQAASVGVKATKLGDKVVSELTTSSTVDLHAADLLGPAGALAALAVNTMNLAIRSGRALEYSKELEKLPRDTQLLWRRQLLQAQSKHAQGYVKVGVATVVADSVSVVGSFIPVIGGIPATLIGSTAGILKFFAEKKLNSELKRTLEKIADDYRSSHSSITENYAAFKEMHETLKDNYAQAIRERDGAKTQTALNLAEAAVKDAAKHLEEYEMCKANFDAYTQALQLIRDLEPKETPMAERELQEVTNTRLSTFGGTETIEFTSTSDFALDYISKPTVGVSKNDRELAKIGITSKKTEVSEKVKAPAPVAQDSRKEKTTSPFRLSEFESYGELSLF